MDVFRVRLNCIDHYQATPTRYDPPLRNDIRSSQLRKEPRVPVIRVFGSTETGQKVCAHIHGAFPYLFVDYPGSLNPDDVNAYIHQLHLSIDHALAVSYRKNVYDGNHRYVAKITLVKGIPFYGFYVGYRFYLKIYMLNPIVMTRLSELLQQEVIMNRVFQPYEAHLEYLLQFMTDYNLYGCAYIDAQRVCFRAPVPRHEDDETCPHLWHSQSVSRRFITDDISLPRVSHCSIEVDICVHDILNRHQVEERQLHHDFTERNHPLPADMKLVHSMAGLWRDETLRRKRMMPHSTSGSSPFPPEVLVSMSANPRDSQPAGWIHEKEYRDQIRELVYQESERDDGTDATAISFDTFVEDIPFESTVKTVLESVEDLYPASLEAESDLTQYDIDDDLTSSIIVDENRILNIQPNEDDVSPDDFEEDENQAANISAGSIFDAQNKSSSISHASKSPNMISRAADRNPRPIRKEHLDSRTLDATLASPSSLRPEGVHTSYLRTGRRTVIPFSGVLLDAAIEHGLVGKAPSTRPVRAGPRFSKRHSPEVLEPTNSKRRRVEFAPVVQASMSKESDDSKTTSSLSDTKIVPSSLSSKGRAKMEAGKDSVLNRLNFPVVKDPHDPSTRLRLSQSSSQRSDDSQVKKHVSLDASVPPTRRSTNTISETSTSMSSDSGTMTITALDPINILDTGFVPRAQCGFFVFHQNSPSVADVVSTLQLHNRPDVIYQGPYYSKDKDVPLRAREYAGQEFRLEGNTLPFLPDFDATGESPANFGVKSQPMLESRGDAELYRKQRLDCSLRSWEIALPPPTFAEVKAWSASLEAGAVDPSHPVLRVSDPELKPYLSQIDGATPKNKFGFKYSQKTKSTSVQHEAQYMSIMSLEIHVNTRGKLVPNPEEDEVQAVFWCSKSDENIAAGNDAPTGYESGIILLSEDSSLTQNMQRLTTTEIIEESSELDLMVRMVEIVRTQDPDILTGYEVHGTSWGFLIERARIKYDYNLCDEFSRMKSQSHGRFGKEADKWGFNTTSTIRITGRHMINIWRSMRGELNLLQYTMENVVWHLLHRRIPHYKWRTLTDWYIGRKPRDLSKLLRYYLTRTKLDIEILETNELTPRTSEQARVLGVDFFSVFSRGSQFKVESIMFRIAKPENFLLVSPSRKQVGMQNALECLPLVMEPQSAFYNSPLVVLDFQSLYPSVMIAYNYCYSTFLGRIVNWRGTNKMGFTEYRRQKRLLELLKDYINIAPNGIMYCKAEIRKSLLAKMLTEILETRVMVKSGMKQDKDDKTLQRLLNNRQLALKLLANVTYGYTSASFSGRMPCSEIADSIVQTGRETLERAIALIHSVDKWKAEVVYGDTDSLFIYLPGRTRHQAFDIGNEIAKTITDMNPRPIKLKFEKVYHPCVLLAKKRYVGYKYESKDQVKPEFDAKGIETVRRDGTPAEQMIEEKALKILFETADLSQVKSYFQRQWTKIMRGGVSIQDFCFAREVKLGTYSERGPPPPGALISTKKMLEDARAEPQYGERVPYVVVSGAPGARLIDRCVAPEDLLGNSHLSLDAEYYISKNLIPPLERIFNLVGANVRQWYDEMPKVQRIHRVDPAPITSLASGYGGKNRNKMAVSVKKTTLESYMKAAGCLVCGTHTKQNNNNNNNNEGSPLCTRCRSDVPASVLRLQTRLNSEENKYLDVMKICQSCAGLAPLDEVSCDSKDCPVFYTRMKQGARYRAEKAAVLPAVQMLLDGEVGMEALEW
ncbi:DNA polymerase family B [Nemania sp. FL0916]|nr:DNA polymerase family B [Nemania sp. FL0916]